MSPFLLSYKEIKSYFCKYLLIIPTLFCKNYLIDSFYLQKQTIEMEYVSEFQMEYERLRQEFFVSGYTSNIVYAETGLTDHVENYNLHIVIFYRNFFGISVFTFPMNEIHFLDSITLNDKTFFDVHISSNGSDSTFWCENIGVIKLIAPTSDTTQISLTLKNYHINN